MATDTTATPMHLLPKPTSKLESATNPAVPWLRVARIVRPQGHRGEVIAELLTDFPQRFDHHPAVSLRPPGAGIPDRTATVESYRLQGGRIVFRFAECASMNDAEALRDHEVVIPWSERMPLAQDEIYIAELAGCALIDIRSERLVGTILDVNREATATALLVVQDANGRELLVPFVKAWEPRWDLEARTLHMALPDGLLELDEAAAE
jgi:16S rRNA processing protein RimM